VKRDLLESLERGAAVGRAIALSRASPAQIGRWFQVWSSDGLFRAPARSPRRSPLNQR
jgi:hypothetical protein